MNGSAQDKLNQSKNFSFFITPWFPPKIDLFYQMTAKNFSLDAKLIIPLSHIFSNAHHPPASFHKHICNTNKAKKQRQKFLMLVNIFLHRLQNAFRVSAKKTRGHKFKMIVHCGTLWLCVSF